MSKHIVVHACGHEVRHELYGPCRQRDWRIEQLRGEECPECRRQRAEAARAEESARAAEANAAAGLPALVGSPKQIAWAESIRAGVMPALDAALSRISPGAPPEMAEFVRALYDSVRTNQSARWWIDQRAALPRDERSAARWAAEQWVARPARQTKT